MENEITKLNAEFGLMLGRINGVHAGLLSIARHLPTSVAAQCATDVRRAAEAIHADALACPVPDSTIAEMNRVLLELAGQLKAASLDQPQSRQRPNG